MASERLAGLTHRDRLSARQEIGRWRPAAGDAGAREAPEGGDRAGARHELRRLRTSGTEGGGLRTRTKRTEKMARRRRTKRTSSKQNPAASSPRPGDTSKGSGPRGAFPWGAWLTLPLKLTLGVGCLFSVFYPPKREEEVKEAPRGGSQKK